MYDLQLDKTEVFDFDEFANHLLEQGLQSSPSEIHGCLTGLLASGAPVEAEFALLALSDVLDLNVHGELASQAMQLYTVTSAALLNEEFDFHPLLPDDETDIAERASALASWCSGFLGGMAQGVATGPESAAKPSKECRGILKDIEAFSQAGEDDEEADEEESEESYFEIAEYLRFAVLNIHMDNQAV
jgi:yecA family protein